MPSVMSPGNLLVACLLFHLLVPITCVAQDSAQDQAAAQEAAQEAAEPSAEADSPASNAGQSDLDTAVIRRIDASTPPQFEAVAALLESALKKGLDEENRAFAKKMLGSVMLERSQQIANNLGQFRGRRLQQMWREALLGLQQAVQNDPSLVEAHLLIAKLNMLPGGDDQEVVDSATKAIELLQDDPHEQSGAYVLRALKQDDDEKRMADLDAAIEKNPENLEAYQARALLRMQSEDIEGAIDDLQRILAEDPANIRLAQLVVGQLVELDRVDDAVELLSKAIETKPSEGLYRIRAFLYRIKGQEDQAFGDLNKALALQPKDPDALLQRAEISLFRDDIKSAKSDLEAATKVVAELGGSIEGSEQALFVRSFIAVEEGRLIDAINDMKTLVARDPGDVRWQLQLAGLYVQDERPRKAIDVYSAILDRDPNNARVLRSRGDALLGVGDHTAAIEDYERALKLVKDLEEGERGGVDLAGVLNNLAWVLCTSPNDSIRDGKRAVELGKQAAELTDFQEAHILSTLAAGYAENGEFEQAIEWSSKAVELGRGGEGDKEHEQLEQLEKELESYRRGEAWREIQETEENEAPILSPDDLIDT